jgi:hypothetical protein
MEHLRRVEAKFVLAGDLVTPFCDATGIDTSGPLNEMFEAFIRHVPAGRSAKLEAMAAGLRPPGADIDAVARSVISGDNTSWTCLPTAALLAGTINAIWANRYTAHVALSRRCDAQAQHPIEIHATVTIVDEHNLWLCDPYHGCGPATVSRGTGSATRPCAAARWEAGPWGWRSTVQVTRADGDSSELGYEQFADSVNAPTLDMVAAITAQPGATQPKWYAKLFTPSGVARMHSVDGTDTRVVEIRDQAVRQVECASWAEGFTVLRSLAQQR